MTVSYTIAVIALRSIPAFVSAFPFTMPKTLFLLLLPLVVFLSGCGERAKLDVTAVRGTVTVDGQPMEGINIIFHPSGGGEIAAFGLTDAKGKYTLSSPSAPVGSGAIAGEYVPTFSKTETEQPLASHSSDEPFEGKVTHLIPEKYGNPKTCGMSPVKVEQGKTNVFDFDLSTK